MLRFSILARPLAIKVWVLIVSLLLSSVSISAETVRVAVASNFHSTLNTLAQNFEEQTGHRVLISSGSSGQLAAHIIQGAPFDLFLSADSERVQLLVERGLGIEGTRATYALGKLVTVSSSSLPMESLKNNSFTRLALANPKLAPYGRAGEETLAYYDLTIEKQRKVVANNVIQAFHHWHTGNVDQAIVSLAQVVDADIEATHYAEIPAQAYSKIEQQMLLLSESRVAMEFQRFLKSDFATELIRSRGYDTQ